MSEGFGDRLRELRRRGGLTQQGLARRAGLSVSTVARLEQGGLPSPATVAALARALGVRDGALRDPPEAPAQSGGGQWRAVAGRRKRAATRRTGPGRMTDFLSSPTPLKPHYVGNLWDVLEALRLPTVFPSDAR
jgi:transcriptional regulator with XRE-family HTH domain